MSRSRDVYQFFVGRVVMMIFHGVVGVVEIDLDLSDLKFVFIKCYEYVNMKHFF